MGRIRTMLGAHGLTDFFAILKKRILKYSQVSGWKKLIEAKKLVLDKDKSANFDMMLW